MDKRAIGLAVTNLGWYFFKLILHAAVSGIYCSVRVAWSLGKGISAFPREVVYRYL